MTHVGCRKNTAKTSRLRWKVLGIWLALDKFDKAIAGIRRDYLKS